MNLNTNKGILNFNDFCVNPCCIPLNFLRDFLVFSNGNSFSILIFKFYKLYSTLQYDVL